MIHFQNFNQFFNDLHNSINAKKEVYVFSHEEEGNYDLYRDDFNDCIHYYVHPLFSVDAIQRAVICEVHDGLLYEDTPDRLISCKDYFFDEDEMIERLAFFPAK